MSRRAGALSAERTVYLDNKLRHGRPGYEVVTPLRLDGVWHVLVNRGWVEAAATRAVLPRVPAPAGEVRIEGVGARAACRMRSSSARPTRAKCGRTSTSPRSPAKPGLRLQPIVIEQHSPAADGLMRDWPRPDAGIEKHESYALQWYSLAALAVVLFVALSFRRAGRALSSSPCSSCARRRSCSAGLPTTSAGAPAAPGNYGELIAPRPLSGAPFEELRGSGCWSASTPRPATPIARESSTSCARCARRRARTRRASSALWVLTDAASPRAELRRCDRGHAHIAGRGRRRFPGNPVDHIYLVDPLGNLMMRFPRDPDPSKMLKDLQRLHEVLAGRLMRGLALAAAALAFIVVVVGAYVRLSDAGLGCPDWPLCYGQPVPSEIARRRCARQGVEGNGPPLPRRYPGRCSSWS